MNLGETFTWLATHWAGPGGIGARLAQHLLLTLAVVAVAAIVALPLGVLIGHTHKGAAVVGASVGAARAIPTLGLLTLFGLALGIGLRAPVLALVILALPSLLAGAYAGVETVPPAVVEAARAVGLSETQIVWRVELPLGAPVIIGGLRAATLQVVSTATLAAYIADTGLGRFLFIGLKSRDYAQMVGGAILVIALALILEVTLAATQRLVSVHVTHPRQ
ncbi:MAG: ABC transporter permease [Propionibacteriaceae bacterium]|jgi:osmoprotectant transport system permease protein|nr:ABC transporter permease [Propionibacteriaceae bacterium]